MKLVASGMIMFKQTRVLEEEEKEAQRKSDKNPGYLTCLSPLLWLCINAVCSLQQEQIIQLSLNKNKRQNTEERKQMYIYIYRPTLKWVSFLSLKE